MSFQVAVVVFLVVCAAHVTLLERESSIVNYGVKGRESSTRERFDIAILALTH